MSYYYEWRPYVPVARRRANAARFAAKLAKKEGRALAPVKIEGRKIVQSFWGQAWCDNLERYSDFANRLPRGRTYVRNGSIIDLSIDRGAVRAIVSGSEIYRVNVKIRTLAKPAWTCIKRDCSQSIDSLIDLLQGRFDQGVMQRLSRSQGGLFPQPKEIEMKCSCPDYATLCKHVAAVLYGVGARLDTAPELLFTLRAVDHLELVNQAIAEGNLERTLAAGRDGGLAGADLGEVFGIDIEAGHAAPKRPSRGKGRPPVAAATESVPSRRRKAANDNKPSEGKTSRRVRAAAATRRARSENRGEKATAVATRHKTAAASATPKRKVG